MLLGQLLQHSHTQLQTAFEKGCLSFGHGTTNAWDEAVWLTLWALNLPLDSDLSSLQSHPVSKQQEEAVKNIVLQRINSRKPAAYLTQQAYLQGVAFYIDERSIVPRSLIAESIAQGSFDAWLSAQTHHALDLCTGNGSLAVLLALAYPDLHITASDISHDALAVAHINIALHQLKHRITLLQTDGLQGLHSPNLHIINHAVSPYLQQPSTTNQAISSTTDENNLKTLDKYTTRILPSCFDLIVCNPPYVNADSMTHLPDEYRQEPALALASGVDGMDFIRRLLPTAHHFLSDHGVLVLEIGHERVHFEAAFPSLPVHWLNTSAGDDQVMLIERDALVFFNS